jgi:formate hydrogenlyase subunit 4
VTAAAQTGGLVVQLVAVVAGAPFVVGLMRQVRARLEGRVGAGTAQPWRDLRKQLAKQTITPRGTTAVFGAAPLVLAATSLVITAIIPVVTTASPLDGGGDLFAVVGLLLAGTVALTLGGLDTGTAFGGMGASREVTIAALVEPTILVAGLALSVPVGSSNLGRIVAATVHNPGRVTTPAAALAFLALVVVVIAETGRLPVDNPATHLELTMVHEAMILEYTGPRLALIEWASAVRLTVLLALVANLFAPWGIADAHSSPLGVLLGLVVITAKVAVLAAALAAAEVFVAKLRLFRVPELLAGSFLVGLLAVTASYFLSSSTA